MYGLSQGRMFTYWPVPMRRSVISKSRCQAGSVLDVSCLYVYPVYVTTVRLAFVFLLSHICKCICLCEGLSGNVAPIRYLSCQGSVVISSQKLIWTGRRPECRVETLFTRIGHPAPRLTARMPGPFAVRLRKKTREVEFSPASASADRSSDAPSFFRHYVLAAEMISGLCDRCIL